MPRKKLLRYVPFCVGLLTGAGICWLRGHMERVLTDSFSIALAAGLGLYAMALLAGLALNWLLAAIFWRCAQCRRMISPNFSGTHCGHCGRKVEETPGC